MVEIEVFNNYVTAFYSYTVAEIALFTYRVRKRRSGGLAFAVIGKNNIIIRLSRLADDEGAGELRSAFKAHRISRQERGIFHLSQGFPRGCFAGSGMLIVPFLSVHIVSYSRLYLVMPAF